MKLIEDEDRWFLDELIRRANTYGKGYFTFAHLIAITLPKNLHEQLRQLVNGPVWDGDVICKTDRDALISLGLAVRVCCNGEQGYTGARYLAYSVLDRIDAIKAGRIAA